MDGAEQVREDVEQPQREGLVVGGEVVEHDGERVADGLLDHA